MLAGLGRLLYWACMAVAVTLIALAVYAPFRGDYLVTPLFLVLHPPGRADGSRFPIGVRWPLALIDCTQASPRFPSPWSVEDIGAAFVVKDGNSQQLAYVSAAKLLTKDEMPTPNQ